MRKLLIISIFMVVQGMAPAEKAKPNADKRIQNTIDVPNPQVLMNIDHQSSVAPCVSFWPNVNEPLLDVIKDLTGQESVNNEVKYEEDNHMSASSIYARRLNIIKTGIQPLRPHKGGK